MTQKLDDLSEDELKALKAVARLWTMIQGWCRINKWIALTIFAALIVLAQAVDAIRSLLHNLTGLPK